MPFFKLFPLLKIFGSMEVISQITVLKVKKYIQLLFIITSWPFPIEFSQLFK